MGEKKPIIPPVNRELLLSELTKEKLLRISNFGDSEIYLISHKDSPNLLNEIGRLRELSFRMAGGGTGKACDLDKYDTSENPYLQLVVWDPKELEIIGGYRFIVVKNVLDNIDGQLATANLFNFSEKFKTEYLPYTIELGRSFVQPEYQPVVNSRKGMFALDNLWDGLGALIIEYPEIKYFFGKVTMYKHYDIESRNILLSFLKLYFDDKNSLLKAKEPVVINYDKYKSLFKGKNYKEDYKILTKLLKNKDEKIPPLINAYMNLSPSMICFDTVQNDFFGGVEETAILININDIYNSKKDRHINSYLSNPEFNQDS